MSCDFSKRESTEYITQFMGDNPWLIDVRGTVPYPKQAAKQTAPATPDKRAPMKRKNLNLVVVGG